MRPQLRSRLGLGAAFIGFAIIVTELDFALRSAASLHWWTNSQHPIFNLPAVRPLSERMVYYLPAILLALASVFGCIALYRSVQRRAHWSWYAASLAPVLALLFIYHPPLTHAQVLHVSEAVLPWAVGMIGGGWNSALSQGLQIALYLAAAALVLAIALAIPRRSGKGRT